MRCDVSTFEDLGLPFHHGNETGQMLTSFIFGKRFNSDKEGLETEHEARYRNEMRRYTYTLVSPNMSTMSRYFV